jgi:DUF1365 family protein
MPAQEYFTGQRWKSGDKEMLIVDREPGWVTVNVTKKITSQAMRMWIRNNKAKLK